MGLDGHDHGHGQRHEVLESIVGTHGRAQYPHYPQKTGAREATCCPKTGSAKAFRWRGVRSGSAEFLGHAWSTPLGGTHEVVARTTHDPKIPRPSSTSQPRRTSHTHTHRGQQDRRRRDHAQGPRCARRPTDAHGRRHADTTHARPARRRLKPNTHTLATGAAEG